MTEKRVLVYILVFLVSLAGFYFVGEVDSFILKGVFGLIGFVIIFEVVLFVFRERRIEFSDGAGRYSMLCKDCGWEWMSNTTEIVPKKCSNCGSEKNLEILGWRKIKDFVKKKEADLKKYF
tara:strand:- start:113 stop:475 length:363 start_codon:yes stop_codon:yes gene_type:complete